MGRRITETRRLGAILRTRTRAMITRHVEEQIRDGRWKDNLNLLYKAYGTVIYEL